MSIITKTHSIDATADQVWATLSDFSGVHLWHPKVATSPLQSANNTGVGASRICNFHDGTSVHETIIAYVEGVSMTVELSKFSMPLHRAEATIALRVLSPTRTEVSFSMDYDVKYGFLGSMMNSLMMQPMMSKMFGQILAGLDHHVVNGEGVGSDGEASVAA